MKRRKFLSALGFVSGATIIGLPAITAKTVEPEIFDPKLGMMPTDKKGIEDLILDKVLNKEQQFGNLYVSLHSTEQVWDEKQSKFIGSVTKEVSYKEYSRMPVKFKMSKSGLSVKNIEPIMFPECTSGDVFVDGWDVVNKDGVTLFSGEFGGEFGYRVKIQSGMIPSIDNLKIKIE